MSRVITVKNKPGIYFYEVAGNLDNVQLLTGLVLTLFFLTIYVFTGIRIFMLLANLPLFIMGL